MILKYPEFCCEKNCNKVITINLISLYSVKIDLLYIFPETLIEFLLVLNLRLICIYILKYISQNKVMAQNKLMSYAPHIYRFRNIHGVFFFNNESQHSCLRGVSCPYNLKLTYESNLNRSLINLNSFCVWLNVSPTVMYKT